MPKKPKALIYCRISRDPEGLRVGVARQEEDCRTLAKRDALDVAGVYIDNDAGASTLSRKPRPQYAAMLEAVRTGQAEVIIGYSNSRLTRRPMELEDLITLHDQTGARIRTVVSGEDDLATADGRMVARIKASIDAGEAERIAERVRRAHLQLVRAGATNHGGRPFGWAADKLTRHPVESLLIEQAVADILVGVPLRVIARQWNARGIATSRGKEWTHTTVRRLLVRPRLAGWRTHHGQIALDAAGRPIRGVWEPILDQDTYDLLLASLARDNAAGQRRERRRYLLSGIARCGTCGSRMHGQWTSQQRHQYSCSSERGDHSVTIHGPNLDSYIEAVVQAVLDRDDFELPEGEPAPLPGTSRLEQIPDLIAELMAAFNAGRLSGTVVFGQVEQLEAELADLRAERAQAISAAPPPIQVDDFAELDTERRRAVVETLISAVVIMPASRRGEKWNEERVQVSWKGKQ